MPLQNPAAADALFKDLQSDLEFKSVVDVTVPAPANNSITMNWVSRNGWSVTAISRIDAAGPVALAVAGLPTANGNHTDGGRPANTPHKYRFSMGGPNGATRSIDFDFRTTP